ncbi:MAG: Arginyl-tRNA--protein transferase 1 [Claussenomyces sp. TS43310]|nr:MAG: Arginyl-tRNA--protein transferase 1 [Claussenomyces sp. TS43310]
MQSSEGMHFTPEPDPDSEPGLGSGASSSSEAFSSLSPIGHAYYASTKLLTVQFYEDLICRGWRRSGTILYKPDLKASCCPHYTIRLDSLVFKATKDQRQALNRFNRFILGDDVIAKNARVRPKSREEAAKKRTQFNLLERVHESERYNLATSPVPAHDFVVTLEPDNFTEEKYAVFQNYQRLVHREPSWKISRNGFKTFLCDSPLVRESAIHVGKERRLGSYHQCYRLDGRLVAVGVLDLLPHAVSAVYFMYHEDLSKWSPGKLSALREAALAVEEGYRWYMMGFYIHSCQKMRYKGDFHPQFILDPESYKWDPLDDQMKRRLDESKYVSSSHGMIVAASEAATPEADRGNNVADIEVQRDSAISSDDDVVGEEPALVPLFGRGMPGIMTRPELESLDLGGIKVRISGQLHEVREFLGWNAASFDDPNSIKCLIGDLVAALGPDLAGRMFILLG